MLMYIAHSLSFVNPFTIQESLSTRYIFFSCNGGAELAGGGGNPRGFFALFAFACPPKSDKVRPWRYEEAMIQVFRTK